MLEQWAIKSSFVDYIVHLFPHHMNILTLVDPNCTNIYFEYSNSWNACIIKFHIVCSNVFPLKITFITDVCILSYATKTSFQSVFCKDTCFRCVRILIHNGFFLLCIMISHSHIRNRNKFLLCINILTHYKNSYTQWEFIFIMHFFLMQQKTSFHF